MDYDTEKKEGKTMQSSEFYNQGGAGGFGGYGYGGGFPAFGLFGAIGLNDGFGRRGDYEGHNDCIGQRITDLQIAGVNTNINDAENHITQGILSQTNALGSLIDNGTDRAVTTTRNVGDVLLSQGSTIKDAVQAVQFQNSLQTQTLLESNCNQTQKILDKMCENETQALRDQLSKMTLEKELNERGLFPGSGPVIQPHNACTHSTSDDIANQVNVILQNGLANFANQMPGLVATEVAKNLK
ncbi:MAG: hypothetical protein ACK5NF_03240 [Bacilli bacterium]